MSCITASLPFPDKWVQQRNRNGEIKEKEKFEMCRDIGREQREEQRENILVSACLLGEKCKYSGESNYSREVVEFLKRTGADIVPVCPEVLGGLPTPRIPAEIRNGRVVTEDGRDVTEEYEKGAGKTRSLAKEKDCRRAVLKERSPSCGCGLIYDGTFTKTLVPGDGMTVRVLKEDGICVYGESSLPVI